MVRTYWRSGSKRCCLVFPPTFCSSSWRSLAFKASSTNTWMNSWRVGGEASLSLCLSSVQLCILDANPPIIPSRVHSFMTTLCCWLVSCAAACACFSSRFDVSCTSCSNGWGDPGFHGFANLVFLSLSTSASGVIAPDDATTPVAPRINAAIRSNPHSLVNIQRVALNPWNNGFVEYASPFSYLSISRGST